MIMGRSHSVERDGAHHREGPATPAGAGHPGQMMIVERVAVLSFGEVGHGDFAAQLSTRPGHRVRFCALLRADTGLPPVSVDAYLHLAITR
jgi:hypothetical protein